MNLHAQPSDRQPGAVYEIRIRESTTDTSPTCTKPAALPPARTADAGAAAHGTAATALAAILAALIAARIPAMNAHEATERHRTPAGNTGRPHPRNDGGQHVERSDGRRAAPADTVAVVHECTVTVRLTLNDHPVGSRTRLIELGGYHVALSTVIPDARLALELHSSYLGHPTTTTRATHLTIAPRHAHTRVTEHEYAQLPVTHARERCLLDHLQVLVELASELGHTLAVDVPEHAPA